MPRARSRPLQPSPPVTGPALGRRCSTAAAYDEVAPTAFPEPSWRAPPRWPPEPRPRPCSRRQGGPLRASAEGAKPSPMSTFVYVPDRSGPPAVSSFFNLPRPLQPARRFRFYQVPGAHRAAPDVRFCKVRRPPRPARDLKFPEAGRAAEPLAMTSFVRSTRRSGSPTIPTFPNLCPVHFGHPGAGGCGSVTGRLGAASGRIIALPSVGSHHRR